MVIKKHHLWDLDYRTAIELQKELFKEVVLHDRQQLII